MAILKMEQVVVDAVFDSKGDIFEYIGKKATAQGVVKDEQEFIKGLYDREKEMSTCFDHGIAIPHCRNDSVNEAAVYIVKTVKDVPWDESKSANFIILLTVPNSEDMTHIKLLSSIARKLVNDDFVAKILGAKTQEDIFECFKEYA